MDDQELWNELSAEYPLNQFQDSTESIFDSYFDVEELGPSDVEPENPDDPDQDNDLSVVPFWANEYEVADNDTAVETFRNQQCCTNNCVKNFSVMELQQFRAECAEMDYRENSVNMLDTVLLFKFQSLACDENAVTHARKRSLTERQRLKVRFHMKGIPVCRTTFLFCHNITHHRLDRLLRVFKTEGAIENKHGNYRGSPANRTTFQAVQEVVMFLRHYAEQHALFMPWRLSQKFAIVKLLPTSCTKKSVHDEYTKSCEQSKMEAVSYGVFTQIWRSCCNDICILRPRSDLCATCQNYFTSNNALAGKSEEEKIAFIRLAETHLKIVQVERAAYYETIESTRKSYNAALASGIVLLPNSTVLRRFNLTSHISFDFAQQISVPSDPQQPGPIYFLTPYKIGIFGVMNDTARRQANYLIPEAVSVSKGANVVISLLHNYLETYLHGEVQLELHADNCVAQNKNNYVLAYLAWRVLSRRNTRIRYRFLPVGHTKFTCDMAFGLFKKVFRHHSAHTLADVTNIFEKSTPETKLNFAVACGTEQGDILIPIFDWQTFFELHTLHKLPNITMYSQFIFSTSQSSVVLVKRDSEDIGCNHCLFDFDIPNTDFNTLQRLNQLIPEGLSDTRKKYLYEKIRPYTREDARDTLCPEPLEYLLHEVKTSDDFDPDQPSTSTSMPKRRRGRPKKQ